LGTLNLAKSILAIDHFPYASRKYAGGNLRLPSQGYGFWLVHRAIERDAVIVLTRGENRWLRDVPKLREYKGLCTLRNPQTATISRGNCDTFDRILRAIESSIA